MNMNIKKKYEQARLYQILGKELYSNMSVINTINKLNSNIYNTIYRVQKEGDFKKYDFSNYLAKTLYYTKHAHELSSDIKELSETLIKFYGDRVISYVDDAQFNDLKNKNDKLKKDVEDLRQEWNKDYDKIFSSLYPNYNK